MGRNLDLENCANKQEAVLAAYVEEFEENERRICDEGAWAISLDLAYPVNADTHYMWGASIRRNRARRRLAPQRRPRCQATI